MTGDTINGSLSCCILQARKLRHSQVPFLRKYKLGGFKVKSCLKSEKLKGSFRILNPLLPNVPFS